jgi:hypothetical protein
MSFKINIANFDIINKTVTSVYSSNKIPVISIIDLDNNNASVNDSMNNPIIYRVIQTISYTPAYKENEVEINDTVKFIFSDESFLVITDAVNNYQCNINSKSTPVRTFQSA